jgi:hypothetical protein
LARGLIAPLRTSRAGHAYGRRRNKVKICYLITLYHKFAQAVRLVRRLSAPNCSFVFHIDSAAEPRQLAQFRSELEDVKGIAYATSVRSRWGSYNAALANIRCFQTALRMGPFDRYVLISGQDYPIASRSEIDEFFAGHTNIEYVEAFARDVTDKDAFGWSPYYRFRRYHVWLGDRRLVLPLLRKGAPPTTRIFHGSEWCALTQAGAEYVADQFEANEALRRYFKTSFLVDEAYIPTLLMNSRFSDRIAGVNLTYEQWTPSSGPHPRVLTQADLGALLASPKLFARKFDSSVDEAVMDRLDEATRGSVSTLTPSRRNARASIHGERAIRDRDLALHAAR